MAVHGVLVTEAMPRYVALADPATDEGAAFVTARRSTGWSTALLVGLRAPLSLVALANIGLGYVVWLPLRAAASLVSWTWSLASVVFVAWAVTSDEFRDFLESLCPSPTALLPALLYHPDGQLALRRLKAWACGNDTAASATDSCRLHLRIGPLGPAWFVAHWLVGPRPAAPAMRGAANDYAVVLILTLAISGALATFPAALPLTIACWALGFALARWPLDGHSTALFQALQPRAPKLGGGGRCACASCCSCASCRSGCVLLLGLDNALALGLLLGCVVLPSALPSFLLVRDVQAFAFGIFCYVACTDSSSRHIAAAVARTGSQRGPATGGAAAAATSAAGSPPHYGGARARSPPPQPVTHVEASTLSV